jgi:transcriptional regulator with XRE-family HTH domain
MNIGNTIKELRKKRGISQGEFAKLCEISQTSLSQIETGAKKPSKTTLKKVCEHLEVSEPLLYVLSLEDVDVPENKKEVYNTIYPHVRKLLDAILSD